MIVIKYGELLKLCRQSRNITQIDLANKTYVTQAQISSYETGRVVPRIDIFSDLIEACGYEIGIKEMKDSFTAEDMAKFMEENR